MSAYETGWADGYEIGLKRIVLYGWDQFDSYFREAMAKVEPDAANWKHEWNYGEGAKAGVREAWLVRRGEIE